MPAAASASSVWSACCGSAASVWLLTALAGLAMAALHLNRRSQGCCTNDARHAGPPVIPDVVFETGHWVILHPTAAAAVAAVEAEGMRHA